jgi:hypothetical protein
MRYGSRNPKVRADHRLVVRARQRVASALPDRRWVIYEELPYPRKPSAQVAALAELSSAG